MNSVTTTPRKPPKITYSPVDPTSVMATRCPFWKPKVTANLCSIT